MPIDKTSEYLDRRDVLRLQADTPDKNTGKMWQPSYKTEMTEGRLAAFLLLFDAFTIVTLISNSSTTSLWSGVVSRIWTI